MHAKVRAQAPDFQTDINLASKLRQVLSESEHSWQYCFLERGGDGNEVYLSPKQLIEASESMAEKLVESTPAGSSIILLLDHGPDFLIAFLACIFAQRIAIPSPVPRFGLHEERFRQMFKLCLHAYVLAKEKNFKTVQQVLCDEGEQFESNLLSFELVSADIKPVLKGELPGFSTAPEAPVAVQFTSGSTSQPKGVMISSKNILTNHDEVASRWCFHHDKVVLSWLPVFHDMGLFGGLIYPLLSGLKVVQMDPLHFIQKPQRWLEAISRFKVNFSGGPAFAYDICNELDRNKLSKSIDLSSWEVAFCGADYVPSNTMALFRSNYSSCNLSPSSVIPVYGLAEATLFVAGEPNPNYLSSKKYDGNFTEGCYLGGGDRFDIEIRDIKSNDILLDGEVGEICYEGGSVTQGYYLQESGLFSGMLKTGDLGFIQDGHLFVCGRIKDLIVKYGQNISPSSIEQLASSVNTLLNPHAAAAFQIGFPDGPVVLLIEVKKEAKGFLSDQGGLRRIIVNRVQQALGISLSKVAFLKRGELMRTSSGKIQRQAVARKFQLEHHFAEADDVDS